ncbi:unnamed protein product [Angiostrongylus costaricensis]|uniref:Uncharacterized protein n=1 Tax=Angiostrongylus costaricensis TaxID=334426 RepID=A0A0R3PBQ9_ANGCS|nr:unnamed protein product [Angiostrongylus costaricensis]
MPRGTDSYQCDVIAQIELQLSGNVTSSSLWSYEQVSSRLLVARRSPPPPCQKPHQPQGRSLSFSLVSFSL